MAGNSSRRGARRTPGSKKGQTERYGRSGEAAAAGKGPDAESAGAHGTPGGSSIPRRPRRNDVAALRADRCLEPRFTAQ